MPIAPIAPAGSRPDSAPMAAPPPRYHAEPIDRAALRRATGPAEPVGDGVYRTRRPAVALLLVAIVALFEFPALRLVLDGAFGGPVSASAVIGGSLMMLALPAFALGVYALATGAGRLPDRSAAAAWLRPPLAYLVVGTVLLVAAALAAA
jgi:hypothetical protein